MGLRLDFASAMIEEIVMVARSSSVFGRYTQRL